MRQLGTQNYDSGEWRLFIDNAKINLKAVPLHNRNKLSLIILTYFVNMKEIYGNMAIVI